MNGKDEKKLRFGGASSDTREISNLMEYNSGFTTTVSQYIVHLVKVGKDCVEWPVSALRLLCCFMELASRMDHSGLSTAADTLNLQDLERFEQALEHLANCSPELDLIVQREGETMYLLDANLSRSSRQSCSQKKRKRSNEDDSGEDEPVEESRSESSSPMGDDSLGQFTDIFNKPSAKSRLLAKRVSSLLRTSQSC